MPKGKDKDKDGKKKDHKGGKKRYGGHHGYKGVPKKRIRRLVKGIIKQETRDLKDERRSVRREAREGRRASARDYAAAKGDIRHIYGQAGGYQNFLKNQTAEAYDEQSAKQQAAQEALQRSLGDTYSGAQQDIMGELERLGISGAGNLSGLMRDQAFNQSQAQLQGESARSTMDIGANNAAQMSNLMSGMIQGGMASNIGQQLQAKSDRNAEIGAARREAMSEINDAIKTVKRSRPELFFELLNQLQETGWNQYVQGRQLKKMNKK